MSCWYAGIGSRKTPRVICEMMTRLAQRFAADGYWLRSGGTVGADQAFELGAPGQWLSWRAKDATEAAITMSMTYHPAPGRCTDYARKLLGRNAMIILGRNLDQPVAFVVTWTPLDSVKGGTGHSIRIAQAHNIPVYNLASTEAWDWAHALVSSPPKG